MEEEERRPLRFFSEPGGKKRRRWSLYGESSELFSYPSDSSKGGLVIEVSQCTILKPESKGQKTRS